MSFSEIMYWLAENYWYGVGVATAVVVAFYILVSISICSGARKRGVDVSIGAMIPVWHIKYVFAGRDPKPKKPKKPKKVKEGKSKKLERVEEPEEELIQLD